MVVIVLMVEKCNSVYLVSREVAEGCSASHWPPTYKYVIELVPQPLRYFPWEVAAQEAATRSANFLQQVKHTFVSH